MFSARSFGVLIYEKIGKSNSLSVVLESHFVVCRVRVITASDIERIKYFVQYSVNNDIKKYSQSEYRKAVVY